MEKKVDVFLLYSRLKASYGNKQDGFDWWVRNANKLGVYDVDYKTKKLSLRSADDKPSTYIYANLGYVDFGDSDTTRDPIDRVQELTGLSKVDAAKEILSWENIDYDDTSFIPRVPVKKQDVSFAKPYPPFVINEMIARRKNAEHKNRYDLLAKHLFRCCDTQEQARAESLLEIGFAPIDHKYHQNEDRIFVPEKEGDAYYGSFRYNRAAQSKGLLRSKCKRVLFGGHLLKQYPKDVIYCEGHSDTINNIGKGLASVTLGGATTRFNGKLDQLEGRVLHDFPDLDIAGICGATTRGMEILAWNKANPTKKPIEHKVYLWAKCFTSEKIFKVLQGEVPKAELYHSFKEKITLKNNLAYLGTGSMREIQKNFCFNKGYIHPDCPERRNSYTKDYEDLPDYLDIANWTILCEGIKKSGFDFVDFHLMFCGENANNVKKDAYLRYFEKFKF